MNDKLSSALDIRGGWWAEFQRLHLHDYNLAATRYWLLIVGIGALALVLAGASLASLAAVELWQVLGWSLIAAVAAAFPIQIPRSKHSIVTGDIVIFLLLALHGPAAATVAAGVECLIGSARTSARLTSRIASLCAGAAAMTLAGMVFVGSQAWLTDFSLPYAAAHLAALGLAAATYYVANTVPLIQVIYLKRDLKLSFSAWYGATSWVGTLYLVSAVLAGLLSLNALQFGRSASAVGAIIIGLSLALLRAHFRQQISEHEAQEARVAAAELEAAQNQKRFMAAFTHASIGMAIVSHTGTVLQANNALCALLGYDEPLLLQRSFYGVLHPGDAALLKRRVAQDGRHPQEAFSIELRCQGTDHREIWVSLHCAPFDDQATADAGLIFQLHDITSRRRAEGELHHIAYHDSLTDLANRNCFQERLRVAVERSRNEPDFRFAVMYLDVDRFKVVNDSLGHPAGDQLLKIVAKRLNACVRPRDLVARLGGDEFAILLEETHQHDDALKLGRRLLQALDEPARINGTDVRPQASIGITFSDLGDREQDALLRDADLAMYKAKADGKGRLALFDASLRDQLGHKLQLEADLRRAIGEGQLSLDFQPLYNLEPFRLIGFEALARWTHPEAGVVSPGVFIALAEETGCIEALTQWAIDEASHHLATWRRHAPQLDLVMHVNVTGKDLSQPRLVPHVREVLLRHQLPPCTLTLEITESMLMEHRELALQSLGELCALGVKVGIDDFGTGYSSLAYLSTLPFDCLKIDRSFVIGMHNSPQNVEIVRTILSLGRTLNKQVIAEGIETHEQLQRLKQLGTPVGQGYVLARPLPAAKVLDMLLEPCVAPA